MTIVGIYTFYVALSVYTSVMQIGYINIAKRKTPILLGAGDFLKAGNYGVAKEKLAIVNTFVDYLIFIAWIGFGIQALQHQFFMLADDAIKNIVIVMGFVVINYFISLPFSYYEKFVIDAEYGFNKSSLGQWVKDTLISFVMMIVLGALVVWGIYAIMTNFTLWWLWSFLFIFAIVIGINMLYPTFRAMFFDKLKPLEDEELDSEIKRLMDATGFISSGVFVSDASKRDARLNAYLGHFAHGDIYKNIALVGAMLFAMFAIFGNLPESLYMELGLPQAPYVVMILLMLFMPVLGFIMMPIMGIVSRHNEYEADKTGSELGGAAGAIELANALQKLVTENKSFPLSHPMYIFFHYTHPPVIERLKELGVDIGYIDESGLAGKCDANI